MESTGSTMSECRCEIYLSAHADDSLGFQIVIYLCNIAVVGLATWNLPL
jgi:hypothetical protein